MPPSSEWSVFVEAVKSGGAFGGALVLIVMGIIVAIKYGILPMLREAKPISENLKSTSESNERASENNVKASENWVKAAQESAKLAERLQSIGVSHR